MNDTEFEKYLRRFKFFTLNDGFKRKLKDELRAEFLQVRETPQESVGFNRLAFVNIVLLISVMSLALWQNHFPSVTATSGKEPAQMDFSDLTYVHEPGYFPLIASMGVWEAISPGEIKERYEEVGL